MTENDIAFRVIGSAIEVHRELGAGLLENIYHECLYYQLKKDGLFAEREVVLPLSYKELKINQGYKVDLLVENRVVVELKSVAELNDVHLAQTLTYLKLGEYKLGLLINFNIDLLKNGIRRVVNGL